MSAQVEGAPSPPPFSSSSLPPLSLLCALVLSPPPSRLLHLLLLPPLGGHSDLSERSELGSLGENEAKWWSDIGASSEGRHGQGGRVQGGLRRRPGGGGWDTQVSPGGGWDTQVG